MWLSMNVQGPSVHVYRQKCPSSKLTAANKLKFFFQKLSPHIYGHICVKHDFKRLQAHTSLYAFTYFCVPAYLYMEYSTFFWFPKFDVFEKSKPHRSHL